MATVMYRFDYAKFVFNTPRGLWSTLYDRLREVAATRKYHGEWSKSHHVKAMNSFHVDREVTILEIWGEWAQIVEHLSFGVWAPQLTRLDVRAIVWDADGDGVLNLGQKLQRQLTSHNVHVYNTKPASKRHGRDRGGQGFTIGSRKSAFHLTVYKRTGEPVAQEYRFQSKILRDLLEATVSQLPDSSYASSQWLLLSQLCRDYGDRRMQSAMESVGVGTYWPTYASEAAQEYDAAQASFAARLAEIETDPDTYHPPTEQE